MNKTNEKIVLPIIVAKSFVMFPNINATLDISKEESIKSILNASDNYDQTLFMVSQRNLEVDIDKVERNDLFDIGVIVKIKSSRKNPDGSYKITIVGLEKAKIDSISFVGASMEAKVEFIYDIFGESEEEIALIRNISKNIPTSNKAFLSMPSSINSLLQSGASSKVIANTLSHFLNVSYYEKQNLLEINNVNLKLEEIVKRISKEKEIKRIENEIDGKLRESMDKTQKEYILREKLKIIKEELGDVNTKEKDGDQIREILKKKSFPKKIEEKILDELKRYEMTPSASPDSAIIRTYLDLLVNLPWSEKNDENIDIKEVERILDEDHYGLEKPKERIIEYLAVKKFAKNTRSPILCFVGAPGVGKTSLALSIARALKRNFVKISLGGVHDESEIRGHRRTYIGAMPGKIIQGMRKAKVNNPVFVLDEIDKLSSTFRGDPSSALLEVLDPEQNNDFNDHYLDESYDLSNVIFIATANYIGNIPHALRDRLEIINLSSYTEIEKLNIAKNHLIPKQVKWHNLTSHKLKFKDEALTHIIRHYTKESGVRQLERYVAEICRKAITNFLKKSKEDIVEKSITITEVKKMLGKMMFEFSSRETTDEIGLVNGLAYTDYGGDLIPVEVNYFPGKGKVIITGSLGEVMKESASIGIDFIKANAEKFGIKEDMFEKIDIHVHVPEGAVKKDGPSAGITMATAIASAVAKKPVRNDLAMTGELTLRGNVLPIGGLKEKSIAAHRAGIKTIIIPKKNEKDLDDIPKIVRDEIKIIMVSKVDEVFNLALLK